MSTSHTTSVATECAEALYTAMCDLDNAGPNFWSHHAGAFLPANVVCDHHGITQFKAMLAECVQQVLDARTDEERA